MIRVNLAVPRKSRKRLLVARQILVAAVLVVVELVVMGSLWIGQGSEIKRLRGEIGGANSELAALRKVVSKMHNLQRVDKDLEERLRVIDGLRRSQKGPVALLDLVSRSLPRSVWLTSLGQKGSKIEVEGYALDTFGVADFMKNLRSSPSLVQIELISSQQEVVETRKVQKFKLEVAQKESEPEAAAKGGTGIPPKGRPARR